MCDLTAAQAHLESLLGFRIIDVSHYVTALTHPSAVDDPLLSFERLEFLGDASLSMTVASWLFQKLPRADEGQLTKIRSRIVSTENMARLARCLDLGSLMRLGPAAKPTLRTNSKVLEDLLEALIGAIYLDLGQMQAKAFFLGLLDKHTTFEEFLKDTNYKDGAMRLAQAWGCPLPEYVCTPAPEGTWARFSAAVTLCGVRGLGMGCSKRAAEQAAARHALQQLGCLTPDGEPRVIGPEKKSRAEQG